MDIIDGAGKKKQTLKYTGFGGGGKWVRDRFILGTCFS